MAIFWLGQKRDPVHILAVSGWRFHEKLAEDYAVCEKMGADSSDFAGRLLQLTIVVG